MSQGTTIKGKTVSGQNVEVLVNPDGSMVIDDPTSDTLVQALYDAAVRLQPYQNALPYARDSADRMRVIIDTGTSLYTTLYWGSGGGEPLYYNTGSPNSIDARETIEMQSIQNFNEVRQGRWTFS